MLCADFSMEPLLDRLAAARENLLTVGAVHARDVHALCDDVSTMIFPSAVVPPTEATISAVTQKLVALVADIEARLRPVSKEPASALSDSWALLSQSGFLRERSLIDFMLARVAEDRLETTLSANMAHLPAKLLDHSDPNVVEAAQAILAADSLHRRAHGLSYLTLRPELLHQLCWRVVASIEVASGGRDDAVIDNARALLAEYDESRTAQSAARKLAHFLGQSQDDALGDPDEVGLHAYVANLAHRLGLDHDHVLHLIASSSAAPFAVMLRAVGNSAEQAMAVIFRFNGFSLTPRDIGLFSQGFELLDPGDARSLTTQWASARSQYLMSPPGRSGGG
jgi:hypothetical protein